MNVTLYGLKNCDSCRKARQWLADAGVQTRFHDLRADGLDGQRLRDWADACGWQNLLNRRSRSWRELPQTQREPLDAERAIELMTQHPTLIKRPVLETAGSVAVGFSAARYQAALAGAD